MATASFATVLDMMIAVRDLRFKSDRTPAERFMIHCLAVGGRNHAQFFQDAWVLSELAGKRDGFFVEFGAANGVWASNTLLLERDYGWTGILAEPARTWHSELQTKRKCAIDHRCVWTTSGEVLAFNQPAIALHSTLDAFSQLDMHAETRVDGERYDVETVSLNDLLSHWQAPRVIDYLSVDTEGSELEILSHFDFDAWEVRLISVEHNFSDQRQPLYDLLTSKGFTRRLEALSHVDDWYVKAD